MCRHNDLPWNIRKFVHSKLSNVNFSLDLREVEPWSLSKWSHTDIPRLVQGGLGGQVMEDDGSKLEVSRLWNLKTTVEMCECFYFYLKIKNDKNEGDVMVKLSARLSKSRVRFSTRPPAVGLSAKQQLTKISNSVLLLRSHNIAIKNCPEKVKNTLFNWGWK